MLRAERAIEQWQHYWWWVRTGLWLVIGDQDNPLIGRHQWQLLTAIWIVKCELHCAGQWSAERRKWWQLSPDIWLCAIHFRYLQYWPWTMGDKDLRAAAEDRNMTPDKWNYYCRLCGPGYPPHQSNKTATSFNCDNLIGWNLDDIIFRWAKEE